MKEVNNLQVKVTYKVGLGDIEMPDKVHEQLTKAAESGDEIEMGSSEKYPEAYEWIIDNIRQGDCFDFTAEVEDIS